MTSIARSVWNRTTANDGQEDQLVDDGASAGRQPTSNDLENTTSTDEDIIIQDGSSASIKPVYTSQWATLLIIVNVTVGVGLLAMPHALQESGVVSAMLVQAVFLSLIVITCIMCIELTVKSEVQSYHEIIQVHCHPAIYQFSQALILLIVFGAAVAYIVTIGDQSDRLFASLYGPTFCHSWWMNRKFIMSALTLVAIKPLCSARTVDFLKYASLLGVASIGFIFYVVLTEFLQLKKIPSDVNYYPKNWTDVASILPVFSLAYQCHLSLVPTVATVKRREKPKAFVTSSIAMVVAAIIYSSISVIAVLTFGSAIQSDLTQSFPEKTWPILSTIAIVGIKCIVTLPAAFLPARLSLIDLLTNNWERFSHFSETFRRLSVTLVFLDAALLMALYVPNILIAVNLLGCLAVNFIFTLPGLAYLSLVKQNRLEKQHAAGHEDDVPEYTARDTMKRWASFFMIVFGIIMTFVVLYKSIAAMMITDTSPPLCHD